MTVDITSQRSFSFVDTSRQRASGPVAVFMAVTVTLLAACGSSTTAADTELVPTAIAAVSDEGTVTADLVAALEGADLGTLASAIEQVGDSPLLPAGEFTILAPSDDAFLTLTSDETADVLTDPELLLRTLQNHVIDGRLTAAELAERTAVTTIAGAELAVANVDGVLTIGGATVSAPELVVDRGLVHTIDVVFVP